MQVVKPFAALGCLVLAASAISPKLVDMGNEPLRMSPAEFKAFLARNLDTWNKIVAAVK